MSSPTKVLSTTLTLSGLAAPAVTTAHLLLNTQQPEVETKFDVEDISVPILEKTIEPTPALKPTTPAKPVSSSISSTTTHLPDSSSEGNSQISLEIPQNTEQEHQTTEDLHQDNTEDNIATDDGITEEDNSQQETSPSNSQSEEGDSSESQTQEAKPQTEVSDPSTDPETSGDSKKEEEPEPEEVKQKLETSEGASEEKPEQQSLASRVLISEFSNKVEEIIKSFIE